MDKVKAISILMPCHSLDYLNKSIESIVAQSLPKDNFEIFLVADRIDIKQAHTLLDISGLNFKIIESTTPGVVPALNLGLSKIKSKYVARMDHDDVMFPNRLENQFKFMEAHPDYVLLGGQIELIDASDKHIGYSKYKEVVSGEPRDILKVNPLAAPAAIFVHEKAVEIGGFRDFLPEDWDLWVRLREHGAVGNLNELVIKYRVHPNQLSRSKTYELASARIFLTATYFSRRVGIADHPVGAESREFWLENTSSHLRRVSKQFAKLEKEIKKDIKFNHYLELIEYDSNLRNGISLFIRFPLRCFRKILRGILRNLLSKSPK